MSTLPARLRERAAMYDHRTATLVYDAADYIDALTDSGPGSPIARLEYLLAELGRLFPDAHNPNRSDMCEPKYIAAIEALQQRLSRDQSEEVKP